MLEQLSTSIKKYEKTFNYYGDKNYKTLKDYYNWCTGYAIAETVLAAVSTGLAVTFWLCAFWTAGATISYAIGATAQAALSWVGVGLGWSQQVTLGKMVDDFNEKRTPEFMEMQKWWEENSYSLVTESEYVEANLNKFDPNSIRLIYGEVSAWFQTILAPFVITVPQIVIEIIGVLFSWAPYAMFNNLTLLEVAMEKLPYFFKNFGNVLQSFVWREVDFLDEMNMMGMAGGTLSGKVGAWFARVTGAVATKESIQRAQSAFSWAVPIYVVTGIVQLGLGIAAIVLLFCFKAAFQDA